MALSNKLQKIVDLPVWEWCRFAPAATATPSAAISDWNMFYSGQTPRYAYYAVGQPFYRYDTWSDTWQQIATCGNTINYDQAVQYVPAHGYYGKAIGPGPGNNTIQMAALNHATLLGEKILITSGTGAGQERTIIAIADPTVHDIGQITTHTALAAAQPGLITDASTTTAIKSWKWNQWRDYQVRITNTLAAAGVDQIRRILYNSYQTLYYGDTNYATMHSWYYPPLASNPANTNSFYQIESSIVTVNSPWTTPPDSSSRFVVKGGGIWQYSGNTVLPFYSLSFYSVIEDVWYWKGAQTTVLLSNTWSTYEASLEAMGECEGGATTNGVWATPLTSGTCSSVASAPYNVRTLIDSSQNMPINKYANQMIRLSGGTGWGQTRSIIANNQTTFIIGRDWDTIPDNTTTYQVIGDSDKLYVLPGRAQAVMGQYSIENDMMTVGRQFDFGVSRTYFVELAPRGIATFTITNGGTSGSYAVGDILTLTNNGLYYGIAGKLKVLTLTGSQVATAMVVSAGTGYYISGTAYATTSGNEGGGSGVGCTITIVSNSIPAQPAMGTSIATHPTRTTGGLFTVTVNAGATGTGYCVNDIIAVTGGGSNAYLRVLSVNTVGAITGVAIEAVGSGYSVNASVSYTNQYVRNSVATDLRAAGTAAGLATPGAGGLNITAITDVGTITTTINHNFTIGDVVNIGGSDALVTNTSQSYFGGTRVVTGVPSLTTFTYNMCGATNATVTATVTAGVVAVAVVNSGGSGGYVAGDVLTCSTGGTGCQVRVITAAGGVVTGVALIASGTGYSNGSSATTGGSGSANCTITLTIAAASAVTSLATTATLGLRYGILSSASTYVANTGLASVAVMAGGSGYNINDLLAIAGGTGGIVKVLTVTSASVATAGAVLSVQVMAFGTGYATGTKATTNLGNGVALGPTGGASLMGTGCTIAVNSVGSVYSVAAAGNLLVNVTAVTSAGALSSVATVFGQHAGTGSSQGNGYSNSTQTLSPSAASAVFNAEFQSAILLIDFTKNWQPNELVGKILETVVPGTVGAGQMRRITANTNHSISVGLAITLPVSGTHKYVIHDPRVFGTENTYKMDEQKYTWGIATSGTSSTLVDNGTGLGRKNDAISVIAGGSGYSVGDILTLSTGGTGGTVTVAAVTTGAVTAVTPLTSGTGYTASVTSATSSSPAGGRSGCTLIINNLNAKNWPVNRWAGYKVKILAGTGVNSSPNELLIASNTATTLTLATNWAFAANPDTTTVYAIMDNWGVCSSTTTNGGCTAVGTPIGGNGLYQVGDILLLTTGVGCFVKVLTVSDGNPTTYLVLNPGSGFTNAATSIATTCLTGTGTFNTVTTTVGATLGSATTYVDAFQNWGANTTSGVLIGRQIRSIAGTSASGVDTPITSVVNAIQVTATPSAAPDGTTQYAILSLMTRGVATFGVSSLLRLFGTTTVERARYMLSWRGNATPQIDRYDICQDMWEFLVPTPLTEGYTLGAMFEYNGKDRVYFTKGTGAIASTAMGVYYLDLVYNQIVPCGHIPYLHGTSLQGNRIFTMSTTDLNSADLEYLYVMRHTGQEMWRCLIYV